MVLLRILWLFLANHNSTNVPNSRIVTDLTYALPGNSTVNTVQHAIIDAAVFSMSSVPSSRGTTGLCNPFLSNGSVNTFPRIGPCYESGDVISNRDGVLRGVCAECLYE
jgi:hypothetical protein